MIRILSILFVLLLFRFIFDLFSLPLYCYYKYKSLHDPDDSVDYFFIGSYSPIFLLFDVMGMLVVFLILYLAYGGI